MSEDHDGQCMAPLPGWAIAKRKGKGSKPLDYVSQYYVIRRLSEIFGGTGWSSQTVRLQSMDMREVTGPKGKRWAVIYEATVEVSAGGCTKSGSAAGSGLDARLADAVHSALTEAETDALKRAARLLGDNLGLALYDKQQRHVDRSIRRPGEQPSDGNGEARREAQGQRGGPGDFGETQRIVNAYDVAETAVDMASVKAMKDAAWGSLGNPEQMTIKAAYDSAVARIGRAG